LTGRQSNGVVDIGSEEFLGPFLHRSHRRTPRGRTHPAEEHPLLWKDPFHRSVDRGTRSGREQGPPPDPICLSLIPTSLRRLRLRLGISGP
jgi:hypothetical protein